LRNRWTSLSTGWSGVV